MIVSWDPPVIDQRNGNITYYHTILTPVQSSGGKIVRNVSFFFLLFFVKIFVENFHVNFYVFLNVF